MLGPCQVCWGLITRLGLMVARWLPRGGEGPAGPGTG